MAKVKVRFASAFLRLTKGEKESEVEAETVKDALYSLISKFGEDFEKRILTEKGEIREVIGICLNGKTIRSLNTRVKEGSEIFIFPIVAGG